MSDNNKPETEDSDLLETEDIARTKEAYSLNLSSNPLYTNMVSSSFKGSNSPTSPKTHKKKFNFEWVLYYMTNKWTYGTY